MQLNVQTGGGNSESIDVADEVFGAEYNEGLIHQLVVTYLANKRQGTRSQKTRSEVSGGGAKPWRQKGTGRARAGTSRSPLWRSGGVTFAAKPADHSKKLNKKMFKVGMRSVVSELVREERLVVVDSFDVESNKTKALVAKLTELGCDDVMIVGGELSDNLCLASRNLYRVGVSTASSVDVLGLMSYKKLLITKAALKSLEERFA